MGALFIKQSCELDDRDGPNKATLDPPDFGIGQPDSVSNGVLAQAVLHSSLAEIPSKVSDHLGAPPSAPIDDPFL